MSFVMGKKIEEKGGFNFDREATREGDSIWARLKEVFESTYEVLHELADERGIDVEDIYASENINREFWGEEFESFAKGEKCNVEVDQSDIIRICMIYEELADKCLEKIFVLLDSKEKNEVVDEALEVINWYLDLIQAKMRRALHAYYYQMLSGKEESDDYNGSAKVALISIDRSIYSWKKLFVSCEPYLREMNHIVVVLEQLRGDVEKQFPDARAFQRPGFESVVFAN